MRWRWSGATQRNDALLLRIALAEQRLPDHAADFAAHRADLAARFDAARRRGDSLHRREEARFRLTMLGDAAGALALARANWDVQREPADRRILERVRRSRRRRRRPCGPHQMGAEREDRRCASGRRGEPHDEAHRHHDGRGPRGDAVDGDGVGAQGERRIPDARPRRHQPARAVGHRAARPRQRARARRERRRRDHLGRAARTPRRHRRVRAAAARPSRRAASRARCAPMRISSTVTPTARTP